MSGGLPPRTAVSTFCSVLSLLTYSVFTFWPGCVASYSEHQVGEGLCLHLGVALPDLDRLGPAATAAGRRAVGAAAGQHGRPGEHGQQSGQVCL